MSAHLQPQHVGQPLQREFRRHIGAAPLACATSPSTDEQLTIRPCPCARITGITRRVRSCRPKRLVSKIASQRAARQILDRAGQAKAPLLYSASSVPPVRRQRLGQRRRRCCPRRHSRCGELSSPSAAQSSQSAALRQVAKTRQPRACSAVRGVEPDAGRAAGDQDGLLWCRRVLERKAARGRRHECRQPARQQDWSCQSSPSDAMRHDLHPHPACAVCIRSPRSACAAAACRGRRRRSRRMFTARTALRCGDVRAGGAGCRRGAVELGDRGDDAVDTAERPAGPPRCAANSGSIDGAVRKRDTDAVAISAAPTGPCCGRLRRESDDCAMPRRWRRRPGRSGSRRIGSRTVRAADCNMIRCVARGACRLG